MCIPELQRLNARMEQLIAENNARRKPKDNVSIPSEQVLAYVYRDHLPEETDSFESIIESLKDATKETYIRHNLKEPSPAAYGNCTGRWDECICAATVWNTFAEINRRKDSEFYYVYVKLPEYRNEATRWHSLLVEPIRTVINNFDRDCTSPLIADSGHDGFILFSSNPDAVILKFRKEKIAELGVHYNFEESVTNLSENNIHMFDNMFNLLGNSVVPSENLVAFLSVKSSLRSDRRYQFVHEGDSTKATLMFIATRGADSGFAQMRVSEFLNNLFYAIVFDNISQVDYQMANIAMSACVSSPLMDPVWTIDKMYECKTVGLITTSILEIITKQ